MLLNKMEVTMYQPGIIGRTREERLDIFKAWNRPDKAFFSSGACHILGHLFFSMHRDEGFKLVSIKPDAGFPGSHMFASDGTWAFDFNGWTLEKELLDAHTKAHSDFHKGWGYTRIVLENGLFDNPEGPLPPEFFPYPPWERAYRYIQQFPSEPPQAKGLQKNTAIPTHPSAIRQEIVEKVFLRRGSLYAFPDLDAAKTALVVVDLDLGTGRDSERLEKIAENINNLAITLRKHGGIVTWVTTPIQKAPENFRAVFGSALTDNYERMGQPGGEATKLWPELKPRKGDIYVTKTGHSAFFPGKCGLHEQLKARGIASILIVGAVTNVCCEASARDAAELQYEVTMVSDALIGQSFGLHEASLATFFRCYGDVRTTEDVARLANSTYAKSLPPLPHYHHL